MPSELLLTNRMTTATDIYSFGLMSEWALPALQPSRQQLCLSCKPDVPLKHVQPAH
jgi:hypothetical protein